MSPLRFRNLYIAIFIINTTVATNLIVQMSLSERTGGLSALFFYLSFFAVILLCSVYFYTKALVEFNKKFSKIGFILLFLFVSASFVLMYYFEFGIILFFFLPIITALFFYVELSIFFSFFKNSG